MAKTEKKKKKGWIPPKTHPWKRQQVGNVKKSAERQLRYERREEIDEFDRYAE